MPVTSRRATFSASSLNAFAECERKWFYRYVCGAVEDRGSSASFYGIAFHAALEEFHGTHARFDGGEPGALGSFLDYCIVASFDRHRTRFDAPVEFELQKRRARRTAKRYLSWLLERARKAPFEVIGCETSIDVTLGGFSFNGFIDRIDRDDASGAVTVVDYKTGAIAKSAGEYLADVVAFREFQLPFYYWARTAAGDNVTRLSLVPLKDALLDVEPIELTVVAQRPPLRPGSGQAPNGRSRNGTTASIAVGDLERARDRMVEIAGTLATATIAHYAVSDDPDACRYCAYKESCRERPARRRRAFRTMIRALDGADARIGNAPLGSDLILITGPAGSGKSEALAQRYAALVAANGIAPAATIVASSHPDGARDLARRIAAKLDDATRAAFELAPFAGITLDALARSIVAEGALAGGLAPDIELLEPDEIEEIFERAAAPLFSAEWAEYLGADIDPEISGLRAPDRFAAAVLRLIVKLRDAGISPEKMLAQSLHGASQFYAKPPNFADPGLLVATKDEHRSSLMVSPAELDRQHRREIDLAKIVAKLYRSYVDELVRHGCLTAIDAIAEATRLLSEQPHLAAAYRERLTFAAVDDAHDLRNGEVRLLQALFGPKLRGVTIAGTLQSAIHTFAGARPEATFKLAATTIELPPGPLVPPATSRRARKRSRPVPSRCKTPIAACACTARPTGTPRSRSSPRASPG